MKIAQPRSHLASGAIACVVLVLLVKILPIETADPMQLGFLGFMAALFLLVLYAEFIRDSRRVSIDSASNRVMVQFRSWRFALVMLTYPLDRFGSVVSYVTPFRFSANLVELVTHSGGEALRLASFHPASRASSFFSVPRDVEAPQAQELRQSLAKAFGLHDKGFLGVRTPGAYVESDRNLIASRYGQDS